MRKAYLAQLQGPSRFTPPGKLTRSEIIKRGRQYISRAEWRRARLRAAITTGGALGGIALAMKFEQQMAWALMADSREFRNTFDAVERGTWAEAHRRVGGHLEGSAYGGVADYLQDLGVSQRAIDEIRKQLHEAIDRVRDEVQGRRPIFCD